MTTHLKRRDHPAWKLIKDKSPRKSSLRWQCKEKEIENINKGVIMMRNMETYMGEDDGKWECGLYKNSIKQKRQLKDLRTKYLWKLINSKRNSYKQMISAKVYSFITMEATLSENILGGK